MSTGAGWVVVVGLSALFACLPQAQAADSERGKLLYENHCTSCHESTVHVRSDRRAKSPAEVAWQIGRWATVLKLEWRYEDAADVLGYLNSQYYKFDACKGP